MLDTDPMQAPATLTLPGHLLPNIKTQPRPGFFLKPLGKNALVSRGKKKKKGKYHEAKVTLVEYQSFLCVLHLEQHQTQHYTPTAQIPFKKNARENRFP